MQLLTWIQQNYVPALQCLAAIVLVGETITRLLIPTSSALGFMEHIGSALSGIMDFLKVPVLIKSESGVVLASPATADSIAATNALKPQ